MSWKHERPGHLVAWWHHTPGITSWCPGAVVQNTFQQRKCTTKGQDIHHYSPFDIIRYFTLWPSSSAQTHHSWWVRRHLDLLLGSSHPPDQLCQVWADVMLIAQNEVLKCMIKLIQIGWHVSVAVASVSLSRSPRFVIEARSSPPEMKPSRSRSKTCGSMARRFHTPKCEVTTLLEDAGSNLSKSDWPMYSNTFGTHRGRVTWSHQLPLSPHSLESFNQLLFCVLGSCYCYYEYCVTCVATWLAHTASVFFWRCIPARVCTVILHHFALNSRWSHILQANEKPRIGFLQLSGHQGQKGMKVDARSVMELAIPTNPLLEFLLCGVLPQWA